MERAVVRRAKLWKELSRREQRCGKSCCKESKGVERAVVRRAKVWKELL